MKSFKTMILDLACHYGYEIRRINPDFRQTARRVKPYTMTSYKRIHMLCQTVEYLCKNDIPGAFIECGVWRGGSMMAVAETLMRLGDTSRDLYLFDTFEGMTPSSEKDRMIADGQLASNFVPVDGKPWCYASLEEVQANLKKTGYPPEKIHYVVGPVEKTLPLPESVPIALLRLDTDWYDSSLHELIHLFPHLVIGGALILDDYGFWSGQKMATEEYLAANKINLYLSQVDNVCYSAIKTKPLVPQ